MPIQANPAIAENPGKSGFYLENLRSIHYTLESSQYTSMFSIH